MDLEMRHLKVVCAIADTGSITKAASMLGLAQPALTAQLKRIERALGGALFVRDRHGARPTPLGDLVLARARVLLPAMKGLRDEAARLAGTGGPIARYRIGGVNSPLLGGLVHRLSIEQPDAEVSTYASWSTDELVQLITNGRLDYALCGACGDARPTLDSSLSWRSIAVDPVCVLLPQAHPLARHDEVELSALADERWAAAPGKSCFQDCFIAACARAGFTPQKVYEADIPGCVGLVEAGLAVALCQATFRPPPGLITRPLAGAPLRWRLLLGWHPEAPAAHTVDRVLAHAIDTYTSIVGRNPGYRAWMERHPAFGAAVV